MSVDGHTVKTPDLIRFGKDVAGPFVAVRRGHGWEIMDRREFSRAVVMNELRRTPLTAEHYEAARRHLAVDGDWMDAL